MILGEIELTNTSHFTNFQTAYFILKLRTNIILVASIMYSKIMYSTKIIIICYFSPFI